MQICIWQYVMISYDFTFTKAFRRYPSHQPDHTLRSKHVISSTQTPWEARFSHKRPGSLQVWVKDPLEVLYKLWVLTSLPQKQSSHTWSFRQLMESLVINHQFKFIPDIITHFFLDPSNSPLTRILSEHTGPQSDLKEFSFYLVVGWGGCACECVFFISSYRLLYFILHTNTSFIHNQIPKQAIQLQSYIYFTNIRYLYTYILYTYCSPVTSLGIF